MDERLYKLNMTYALTDTVVALVSILCFGVSAYFFERWWVNLFSIIPLALFHSHALVLDVDVAQKGGDGNGTT